MERIVFTRITGSLLILAILASGCASSTVLRTTPADADVYVQGQRLGKTPYTYSDRKIAGASTLVTLKKDGYEAYNTTIRKNKKLNVGALISGLLLIYPLFWVMGYDKAYSYDLDEVEVNTQPVAQAEPVKPEIASHNAAADAPEEPEQLPQSTRIEKLLAQGQIEKAVEYAEDQEGAFQYGCFYSIAQYYLDKGDYASAENFFHRSGKTNEGNVRIAEALMRNEIVDSVVVINKKVMPEIPEMRLTAEDDRVLITVDSIVRSATPPQDLVTALKAGNSGFAARPARNADYVLVYFNRTVKKELNLAGNKTFPKVSLADQFGKNYAIILERGPSSIRTSDGGLIMWNPRTTQPEGVIIDYSYMIIFMPVSSTPTRLNYVYEYKNDKNDRKTNTGTMTIDLVQ